MKTPKKRRQNFTTFCADYVKSNNRELYQGGQLMRMPLSIYDFAYDAQNDRDMPSYPKKWKEVKAHLRELNACREAFAGAWAAYWIWKNKVADSSSFERRINWL